MTRERPFAATMQGALVVLMTLSFVMIAQQFSSQVYRLGLLLLVVSTIAQIAFGNIPPTAGFRRSMKLLGITVIIVAIVFGVGIVIAPYLVELGRG